MRDLRCCNTLLLKYAKKKERTQKRQSHKNSFYRNHDHYSFAIRTYYFWTISSLEIFLSKKQPPSRLFCKDRTGVPLWTILELFELCMDLRNYTNRYFVTWENLDNIGNIGVKNKFFKCYTSYIIKIVYNSIYISLNKRHPSVTP